MKKDTLIKSLELLLIPLFSLLNQSCTHGTIKSELITTNDNLKYLVRVDSTNLIKATRDGNIKGNPHYYQLIDSAGDGYLNSVKQEIYTDKGSVFMTRVPNLLDQTEYEKIYAHSRVQALLNR